MKDYYEILEISRNASIEVIERAYYALAKKYHPDLNRYDYDFANEKMKEINEAHDVLRDENKREEYNQLYDLIFFKSNFEKEKKPQAENYSNVEVQKDVRANYLGDFIEKLKEKISGNFNATNVYIGLLLLFFVH
jgi:curved DNA-binding protein CbpA